MNWTKEEEEYLQEKYGTVGIKSIAKNLNRTVSAVVQKANRMKLGAFTLQGEYVTYNQLMIAIGTGKGYSYYNESWIKKRGFPVKYKTVINCRVKVVYIDDFWKWAEENQSFVDFSKIEKNILGKEPKWVDKKRKQDFLRSKRRKLTPWTKTDDAKLRKMLSEYKYTYQEIAAELKRTEGAVVRRMSTLGIKERPLRRSPHEKWTDENLARLKEMIIAGCYNYQDMSLEIGKSSKAIQGKVYVLYKTENLDKVRKILKESG